MQQTAVQTVIFSFFIIVLQFLVYYLIYLVYEAFTLFCNILEQKTQKEQTRKIYRFSSKFLCTARHAIYKYLPRHSQDTWLRNCMICQIFVLRFTWLREVHICAAPLLIIICPKIWLNIHSMWALVVIAKTVLYVL